MSDVNEIILDVLDRNLCSIWNGDVDSYRETISENLSFFDWRFSKITQTPE